MGNVVSPAATSQTGTLGRGFRVRSAPVRLRAAPASPKLVQCLGPSWRSGSISDMEVGPGCSATGGTVRGRRVWVGGCTPGVGGRREELSGRCCAHLGWAIASGCRLAMGREGRRDGAGSGRFVRMRLP